MQREAPRAQVIVPRTKRSVASWAVPIVGLTVVYVILVATVRNQYYQLMLTLVPVWATLGISWNIFSGYSGLVSFGHAAFFGIGAYTLTILFVFFGVTPWIGLPLAGIAGAVAGLIIGYPTFRLRGHYFALSMLAYPLAMLYVFEWLGLQDWDPEFRAEHTFLMCSPSHQHETPRGPWDPRLCVTFSVPRRGGAARAVPL